VTPLLLPLLLLACSFGTTARNEDGGRPGAVPSTTNATAARRAEPAVSRPLHGRCRGWCRAEAPGVSPFQSLCTNTMTINQFEIGFQIRHRAGAPFCCLVGVYESSYAPPDEAVTSLCSRRRSRAGGKVPIDVPVLDAGRIKPGNAPTGAFVTACCSF
jgi:hypothetical protein